jgi:hypothetical protein
MERHAAQIGGQFSVTANENGARVTLIIPAA